MLTPPSNLIIEGQTHISRLSLGRMWTHDSQIGDSVPTTVRLNKIIFWKFRMQRVVEMNGLQRVRRQRFGNQALGGTTAGNESEEQQAMQGSAGSATIGRPHIA